MAYARALPPGSGSTRPEAERAIAEDSASPERNGMMGTVLFDRQEFRASLPYLMRAVRGEPANGDWLLRAGIATIAVGEVAEGQALLQRVREVGGDSVYALSILSETHAGAGQYERAAQEAVNAIRGVRPTIARPFPGALETAVRKIANEAPPHIAAPVLEEAVKWRPSWELGYQGGAHVYTRWGGQHCRRAAELAMELTRFGWTDREIVGLIRGCGPS
jgi:hypothetical protein